MQSDATSDLSLPPATEAAHSAIPPATMAETVTVMEPDAEVSDSEAGMLGDLFGDEEPDDAATQNPTPRRYAGVLIQEHVDTGSLRHPSKPLNYGGTLLEAGGVTVEIHQTKERPKDLSTTETYTAGITWGSAAITAAILESLNLHFINLNIVELGAGTGALGCLIAARCPHSRVLLTDLPYALPMLRENIARNKLTNADVAALAFGDDVPDDTDVLLCSDLIYTVGAKELCWMELASTIGRAVTVCGRGRGRGGVKRGRNVVCWLTMQERFGTRDISSFFEALRVAGEGGIEVTELQHPLLASQDCEDSGYFYWMRLFRISQRG